MSGGEPLTLRLGPSLQVIEPGKPLVMGVVNASPESFSDGVSVGSLDDQLERAHRLLADGADLLDVGGESGVSDRPPVAVEEELRRVVPLVERLAADGTAVSVDTWKPEVARAAVAAGAVMVNDISGLADERLATVCAETGAALVVMHTRAAPKRKTFPGYGDVLGDVLDYLRDRLAVARSHGVADEQLVVDPGPDFAKTPAETITVLRGLAELQSLRRPVLLAVSRKDFVGALTGRRPAERSAGTLAALDAGIAAGAAIVRVHDVAGTRDYLRVRAALRGESPLAELELAPELRRERAG